MSALDVIFTAMPLIAFAGLMLSIRFGKIWNLYIWAVITIATLVLGVVSMSVIKPLDFAPSTLGAIVSDLLVFTYIMAMIYGAFGVRSGNWERVIVAGIFVVLVALTSAVL